MIAAGKGGGGNFSQIADDADEWLWEYQSK